MRPMRSVYSLAWRNLASRRLRTFLTALAIAVGVAAVLATSMIGQAMQVSTATLAARSAAPICRSRLAIARHSMHAGSTSCAHSRMWCWLLPKSFTRRFYLILPVPRSRCSARFQADRSAQQARDLLAELRGPSLWLAINCAATPQASCPAHLLWV